MKIAVITPLFETPWEMFEQCLASVAQQTIPCSHFIVSDGDSRLIPSALNGVQLIVLPQPHQDYGNIARAIGSVSAIGQGFDAISYLDADNWYDVDHLEQMVALHRTTNAMVCSAGRRLYDLQSELLGTCWEVDGENFVDTNCYFLTRPAFNVIPTWYKIPRSLVAIGDREVWRAIKASKLTRAHRTTPSVNYRTSYRAHYEHFGHTAPADAKHVVLTLTPGGQLKSARTVYGATKAAAAKPLEHAESCSVSLCMIAKNEEENLAACLAEIVNLVQEIILIDTGSTDRTKEIAMQYGAKVYDFSWVDSFSAARNESLRHATGEWILWLDADDRFDAENLNKLKQLLGQLPSENHAFLMRQKSLSMDSSRSAFIVDQVRLFRKSPSVQWEYRVHEQILPNLQMEGAKPVLTEISILHLGYQEASLRRHKRMRNRRLLQMELQERPDDGFVLFNMASLCLDDGQFEPAIEHLHRCLEHSPSHASFLSKAHVLLARAYTQSGQRPQALHQCQIGKQRFPQEIELWFEEGIVRCQATIIFPHQRQL